MIAITYYSTILHNKLKLILLCEYILLKVPMDVVPDTANQRPQRDRRRPTHLQHNGHTQGTPDEPAVRARKSNSTACRQVPPRMNNEGADRIERRARAIAAVRDHISGINLNRQPIQDEIDVPTQDRIHVPILPRHVPVAINAEQQILNAEMRRERLIAAVRNHVLNININYPQIVDPLVDLIDPVERIFNETQARDKLRADLILAGTGVMPDTLLP